TQQKPQRGLKLRPTTCSVDASLPSHSCYHLCLIAANSLRSVTREAHSLVSARSRRKILSSVPATSDSSASSSGLLSLQTRMRSRRMMADLSSFDSATSMPPPSQSTPQAKRISWPLSSAIAWWQEPLESKSPERCRYFTPSRNE